MSSFYECSGNPALRQGKPGSGLGLGYGIRFNSHFGQFRVDYVINAFQQKTAYFGINNVGSWAFTRSLRQTFLLHLKAECEGMPMVDIWILISTHRATISASSFWILLLLSLLVFDNLSEKTVRAVSYIAKKNKSMSRKTLACKHFHRGEVTHWRLELLCNWLQMCLLLCER